MKIKNVRNANKVLACLLVVDLYITKMFSMGVLSQTDYELTINNGNNLYTNGEEMPFLPTKEYELSLDEDYEEEIDYGRRLKRKDYNVISHNNYNRNPRSSLGKSNYFGNSRDF